MPQTPGSGKIQGIKKPRPRNTLELITDPDAVRITPTSGGLPIIFADRTNDKGADDRDTVMQSRADAARAQSTRDMSFKGGFSSDMNQSDSDAFALPVNDATETASSVAASANYSWSHNRGASAPTLSHTSGDESTGGAIHTVGTK